MNKQQAEKSSFPILPLHPSVTEKLFYKKKAWEKVFDIDEKEWEGKLPPPSLGTSIAHILEFLSPMFNANLALDLGTCFGYSTYVLAKIVGPEGRVLTVERNEKFAKIARDNFKKTGIDNRVALIMGEATEVIKDLKGPFDLILLDVDKNEYLDLLDSVVALLAPGGHLVTDDVGFISREFPPHLKNLNTHLARYIQAILKRTDLEHIYVPFGDGILISRKLSETDANQLALFTAKKVSKKKVDKVEINEDKKVASLDKKRITKIPLNSSDISEKETVKKEHPEKRLDLSTPEVKIEEKKTVLGPVESFDRETMRKRNLAADKKLKEAGRIPRNLAQNLGKIPKK